jgi:hypothetical protein
MIRTAIQWSTNFGLFPILLRQNDFPIEQNVQNEGDKDPKRVNPCRQVHQSIYYSSTPKGRGLAKRKLKFKSYP